jgi:hypothetical protein
MVKMYGDVPPHYHTLGEELDVLEAWFDTNKKDISALSSAKGLTCLAHDWYAMGMDEEGERLLNRVQDLAPGYFEGPVLIHMAKDDTYDALIRNLQKILARDVLLALGCKF